MDFFFAKPATYFAHYKHREQARCAGTNSSPGGDVGVFQGGVMGRLALSVCMDKKISL
jgi:hypothetical protein